ncbi:hypothetical protein OEZ85_012572 [Tetradesmus obliquus]|uniref:Aldose 1-epimerase n=1 Tax=Tetradesmus obliquus TaxID=3088 RepID=A0ABY8U2Y3_TETOB|nr:hypothetical protein OEZ85_012572 [Tetradesmus obliquus]
MKLYKTSIQILLATAVVAAVSVLAVSAQDITLQNKGGFKVVLTPTGATVQKLLVPSSKGRRRLVNVALGYDNVTGYAMDPHPNFGATVGRVANRIANASFSLDGKNYTLLANDGSSSLHGGAVPWAKAAWRGSASRDELSATFEYTSVDGEAGFPGTVTAKVVYSIPAKGSALAINMSATSDKATPLNIINHAYFNLKGAGNGDILDHVVQLSARYYTPAADEALIPSGVVAPVAGSPYDFTRPKAIRRDLMRANGGAIRGYDTNFVLPPPPGASGKAPEWWAPGTNPQVAHDAPSRPLAWSATVTEPRSGLRLRMLTNAPGMQLYSGNNLDGKQPVPGVVDGKAGGREVYYQRYDGLCLEAQAFPNAINTPAFPSSVLRPGQAFSNRVTYEFGCA